MRKIFVATIFGAGLALLGSAASAQTLRYGMTLPQGENADWRAATAFKAYVEFNTGGKVKVEIYPANQLGGEREMTEQVRDGALDIAFVADGAVSGFYPKLQVFAIPYLFPSAPIAWEVLRGPVVRTMAADIDKTMGLTVLNFSENGFRDFTNSKHAIRTPADMQGLKMRTMESPVYIKMMQSMGSAATPISAAEMVMALQQKVVDGQENAPSTINMMGIADVQKFMSTDEHVFSAMLLLMANDSLEKLTPDERKVVHDAAMLQASVNNSERARSTQANIDAIKAKGVEVYMTSPAEKEMFRAAAQAPVVEYIRAQVGNELVDAMLGDVKRAQTVVYGQ
jgi:tripartite ATP-independent transporter DctP family solute receptor